MPNQIVIVNVSQQLAPLPSLLQRTGAIISQGATTLTTGSYSFLTQAADLVPIQTVGSASVELNAQVTTFFAQGGTQGIYVLELGTGTAAAGVTALISYINAPSLAFYAYWLPKAWAVEATAITMANTYTTLNAKVYFYVTVDYSSEANWKGIKSVIMLNQAAIVPVTEESIGAEIHATLSYNPSTLQKVTPLQYTFAFGVTQLNPSSTQITSLLTNNVNWIGNGAEGGISNALIQNGCTADGFPFNYWYAADWAQIQLDLALSNAVINGSNNVVNPLYYDQNGINTLRKVAQGVVNNGVSFGLFQGAPIVTAVSFADYVAANPSDYALGLYKGLAVTLVPKRGFKQITFYLTVSNIATS